MPRKRQILKTVTDLFDLLLDGLVVFVMGVELADKKTLHKLSEAGLVRVRDVPRISPLLIAFRLGKHELRKLDKRPLKQVLKDLPDTTSDEEAFVEDSIIVRMKSALTNLIEKVKTDFASRFQSTLLEYLVEATPVERLRKEQELAKFTETMKNQLKNAIERASRAEMFSAYEYGVVSSIISSSAKMGIPPEQIKVKVRVHPTACEDCKRLYLEDPDNLESSRTFFLKDLLANGSNAGRPKVDWRPTVPPIHPNCVCVILQTF